MRGPKVQLELKRKSSVSDGGGGLTHTWTTIRKIRGMLALIKGVEYPKTGKETSYATHQFWCSYPRGTKITEADEFSKFGTEQRYRIVYVDDLLEKGWLLKIDLVKVK